MSPELVGPVGLHRELQVALGDGPAAASIGRTRRTMLCATRRSPSRRPAARRPAGYGEQALQAYVEALSVCSRSARLASSVARSASAPSTLTARRPTSAKYSARGDCASAARSGGEGGMGARAEGGPGGVVGGERVARIAPGEVGAVAGDELGELCFVLARRHQEDAGAGLPRRAVERCTWRSRSASSARACALARSGTTPSRYMRAPRALTVPRLTADCRPSAAAKASGTAHAARTFVRTRITGSRILGSSTAPLAAEAGVKWGPTRPTTQAMLRTPARLAILAAGVLLISGRTRPRHPAARASRRRHRPRPAHRRARRRRYWTLTHSQAPASSASSPIRWSAGVAKACAPPPTWSSNSPVRAARPRWSSSCTTRRLRCSRRTAREDVRRDIAAGHAPHDARVLRGGLPQPLLGAARHRGGERRRRAARRAKSWVTSAGQADSYVWSSRAARGRRPDDAVAGAVERARTLGPPARSTGSACAATGRRRCAPTASIVPADAMLGADGAGLDIALTAVLPWFLILSGAFSLGLMEAVTAETTAHLTATRLEHLDQTLAQQPRSRASTSPACGSRPIGIARSSRDTLDARSRPAARTRCCACSRSRPPRPRRRSA